MKGFFYLLFFVCLFPLYAEDVVLPGDPQSVLFAELELFTGETPDWIYSDRHWQEVLTRFYSMKMNSQPVTLLLSGGIRIYSSSCWRMLRKEKLLNRGLSNSTAICPFLL